MHKCTTSKSNKLGEYKDHKCDTALYIVPLATRYPQMKV